jgi:hypothetical protein
MVLITVEAGTCFLNLKKRGYVELSALQICPYLVSLEVLGAQNWAV